MVVDVIIPVYKPGQELVDLLNSLLTQSVKPNKIILMNTEKAYFDLFLQELNVTIDQSMVKVVHLSKSEFDHGKTRNMGVKESTAPYFICMTQDAVPVENDFIDCLIRPLNEEKVAASYGRQLAKEGSSIAEKITREFNYPKESMVKSIDDIDRLGIKTYFCSNVCCAYNREIFEKVGGFINHTIFNEDMIYAATAMQNGYKIAYAADAKVYHSHNYSAKEQFHRNVDVGISQAENPNIFATVKSESEGKKMVITTIRKMIDSKQPLKVIPYIYLTGCKYLGFLIGKNYKKLPSGFVKRCAMNSAYLE
ncbi:MAG: glycosyltransferase family 2 protein [Lachnospiraceae bacterium]|nr:glycosyltransferase family 2 protein [Candidatus Colinaster equi]